MLESPVPLNSPEWFNRNPFKFNNPMPVGDVVRDIVFDQDRHYLALLKRFSRSGGGTEKSVCTQRCPLERNQSNLFRMAGGKRLRLATQSFIHNEMDQLNSPGLCGPRSFHPSSPNFDSQHSILDLTHVSSFVVHVHVLKLLLCFVPLYIYMSL